MPKPRSSESQEDFLERCIPKLINEGYDRSKAVAACHSIYNEAGKSVKKSVIKSEDERLVYGEVYAPLRADVDGEAMTAQEIRKTAYKFLSSGFTSRIDINHNYEESGCLVVESFIARENDPDGFVEGSLVLVELIPDDDLWAAVKRGELNGFSFGGKGVTIKVETEVVMAISLSGETEESTSDGIEKHRHTIEISFTDSGRVVPALTGETLGHRHTVSKTTATDSEADHSHRLIIIEDGGN